MKRRNRVRNSKSIGLVMHLMLHTCLVIAREFHIARPLPEQLILHRCRKLITVYILLILRDPGMSKQFNFGVFYRWVNFILLNKVRFWIVWFSFLFQSPVLYECQIHPKRGCFKRRIALYSELEIILCFPSESDETVTYVFQLSEYRRFVNFMENGWNELIVELLIADKTVIDCCDQLILDKWKFKTSVVADLCQTTANFSVGIISSWNVNRVLKLYCWSSFILWMDYISKKNFKKWKFVATQDSIVFFFP